MTRKKEQSRLDDLKKLVEKIKLATKLTQQEISEKAGFSKTTLAQYYARPTGHENMIKALEFTFKKDLEQFDTKEKRVLIIDDFYPASKEGGKNENNELAYLIEIKNLLRDQNEQLKIQANLTGEIGSLKQRLAFLETSVLINLGRIEDAQKAQSAQIQALAMIQTELPHLTANEIPDRVNEIVTNLLAEKV